MATIPASNQRPASPPVEGAAFVNRRVNKNRPCDACRRRKNRCIKISGEQNTCVLCQSRSIKCTFVRSPPPKKKRRLDDEESSPNATKLRAPAEATQSMTSPKAALEDENHRGSSLLKQTLGHQSAQSNEYLGATTEYELCLISLSRFNRDGESINTSSCTLRRVNQHTHFSMRPDTPAEMDRKFEYLDAVEAIVAPHGQALIDLYFRIVHPSYPILHKKIFLEKYCRTYRELTPTCLAAVYILALNWWQYSPNLVRLAKPNVKELEVLFPKMMADIYQCPKASDIQGGLIFLQRPEGSSWVMTGNLIAMGQDLGLHLDCSDWRVPEWERALRKRLAWALFIQDVWGALIHGRPPYIAQDNWDVKPAEKMDFPETAKDDDDGEGSSEVEKGMLIFVHLISLTEILSDILRAFFTLRAMRNGDNPTEVLEKAKPLQIRLKTWYSNLPPTLSMEETKMRKLSSTGHLHLAYFSTEVTLHRAIIRSFDATNTDPRLKLIARNAARMRFTSAVEFVKRLKPEHLQSFWFFASKVNLAIIGTFGSILWATSDSNEECEFYRSQLAEYRWTLRVSSTAAEFMKFTVGILDDSPVFMTDVKLSATPNHSEAPRHEDTGYVGEQEEMRDPTPLQQYPASNSPAIFDKDTLNFNELWLDNTASGLSGEVGLPWDNTAATGKLPAQTWAYNFDNIPGADGLLGPQSSEDFQGLI